MWSTSEILDSKQYRSTQAFTDDFFKIVKSCEEDDQQTMPIFQSVGELDANNESIWWKITDCGDVQVFNHVEGGVNPEKLEKHLNNGDLFIFNSSLYYGAGSSSTLIVPPKLMKKLQKSKTPEESEGTPLAIAPNGGIEHREDDDKFDSLNHIFGK